MGINTISTYAIFQTTINDVNNKQSELADLQNQLSSGDASQNFQGLGSSATQYMSLESEIGKTTSYINNNTIVSNTLDATNNALTQFITEATSLQSLISTREQGGASAASFGSELNAQWQALAATLNTTSDGQYIFSGTATNTQAVSSSVFPQLQTPGVPDAGYYQGSSQDISVRSQDNTSFNYNVRANDPAFQKIFAGLAMAQEGAANNDADELTQAYNFVQQGLQGVVTLQSTVNSNKLALTNTNSNLQTFQLYWKNIQNNIGNTNLVNVSTQVAVDQGILQAAFQAFAKINSLSLTNYLPNA